MANKKIIIFLFFILGLSLIILNNISTETNLDTCVFNGREFLLTGGTMIIDTQEDLVAEVLRMNRLCNYKE